MPAPATADEFLGLARKSGLLDAAQLRAYLRRRGEAGPPHETPRAMADLLVSDNLVTRYQAEQLLRGKWRNFLLGGKYLVLGPLGSGGMGQVYLCEHKVMRRRVAIKVLPDRSGEPSALQRFHREARAVAQLHHPNIVGGYDIDRDGRLHFLVMEYIDGSTLHTVVKVGGPMGPLRAAHYVSQAAAGLQHAHEAGLVHRDVKPSNLLLDRTGCVKVLDLGLARFFHEESDDLSRRHAEGPIGTLDYMAPEQALDSHQADIRADIYGLGATYYFLLAGHSPFRAESSLRKLICHQFERPQPIRSLRPDVPEGVAAVIDRMTAKAPAERYQTPAQVVEALAPWTRTAVPPPPPEEMPEVIAPARGASEGSAPPALPASLYGPGSAAATSPGRSGDTDPSAGSQLPTAPFPVVAVEAHAPPVPPPDLRLEAPAPHVAPKQAPRPPSSGGKRGRGLALLAGVAVLFLAAAVSLAVYKITTEKGRTPADTAPAGPAVTGDGVAGAPQRLRLLIPAYIYPAGEGLAEWDRIIDSPAATATVVIANPDSGPGKAADANYARVLKRAGERGVTVIGYVSTRYAARPLDEVKGDVDRWLRFYPGTRGIFFDEQASSVEHIRYYAALYEYVRRERGLSLVVTNPGTECAEEYLARPAADVACVVETPKGFSTYSHPAWANRYPADRFAALICTVGSPVQMQKVVREVRENHIGFCFVTDADEPNPWGRLPRYWETEVEVVRQGDAHSP
jgi:serine/threonine protein kinase